MRPSETLLTDEHSDTHAIVLLKTRYVCVEGMVSLHAHDGIYIYSIPVASSLHCQW